MSRLLTEPPDAARGLQARHWIGVVILALAVGAAAFVLPPLIFAKGPVAPSPGPSPANPQAAGAPQQLPGPAPSSGASGPGSTPGRATTSAQAGVVTTRPTTASRTPTARTTTTAPAATPRSTKTPAGVFKPLSKQAEDGTLSGGAQVYDCPTCAGGQRVKHVGRVEAEFTVPAGGERTITITYTVNDFREMSVTVNDTSVMTARKVTGTSWETPQTVSVKADVPAGAVTIAVFGAPYGPDIDAISIS